MKNEIFKKLADKQAKIIKIWFGNQIKFSERTEKILSKQFVKNII